MGKKEYDLKKILLACLALAALIYLMTKVDNDRLSESAWNLPLTGQIILIDPGHGGPDGGASSRGGVLEKEVTLSIAFYLRDFLQESGALVQMTREADIELSTPEAKRMGRRKIEDLKNRLRLINGEDVDLFISIHSNSISSPRWRGAQTFYHPKYKDNRSLAYLIQEELKRNLENTNRQEKMSQDLFLLKHAENPGVLVEVGFLSNPEEAELLESEEYQKQVAFSIYLGILRYAAGEQTPRTE
jgi:N-acetylmuramoyl-L-alanine amidase